MEKNARVTLYSVDRCGYYKRGQKSPELGDLASILQDLQTWLQDKPLGSTRTFDPLGGNFEPVYCFDLRKDSQNQDYLLTTWNEVPSDRGKVAAVNRKSPCGHASIEVSSVHKDCLPGYATYFWWRPAEKAALATVTFDTQRNGLQNLSKYVHEYMSKLASFVEVRKSSTPAGAVREVLGYRESSCDPPEYLIPSFRAGVVRKSTKIDRIRKRRAEITHVVRKNRLSLNLDQNRSLAMKVLRELGIIGPPPSLQGLKIQYEAKFTPSAQELEALIAEWKQQGETSWENVGFRFQGDPSATLWLGGAIASKTFPLDVEVLEGGVIEPASLLEALEGKRREISALLS